MRPAAAPSPPQRLSFRPSWPERKAKIVQNCRPQSRPEGWSTIDSATTVAGAPGRPVTVTAAAGAHNAIDPTWHAAPASGPAILRSELQVRNPANPT